MHVCPGSIIYSSHRLCDYLLPLPIYLSTTYPFSSFFLHLVAMATLEAAGPSIWAIACISTTSKLCTRSTRLCTSPPPINPVHTSLSHAMAPAARKMGIPRFSFSPPPSDQENVVNVPQDMERYLSDLSLEYESVWDTKPAWYAQTKLALKYLLSNFLLCFLFH